ncbi:MAG TPA: folylpolyglutamate synthase/dihydrofolate synthase family protein [Bacteroidales bacterium]|nr:folylpolyglutamate synthase/dihydrofolate synthase family protein [Bacteroidales bacterium]HPF03333.1 folylpolyglutamate synthase/dihydrofolate synthase family protein [Bacteroidales bacterium]HPJ59178.1 folylpolyglutamate synthase/dihydrofolate synthase family protein [Bacteroidales bacterium]HPR12790.1 folylpolyglutamate synthase/dihydrofolate synthase family protein [Bacteroidales bacterium]HRW84394.1 folylpolyglutamate synthase/dihydrofolate synthase family protein [Bacteroidales bacteri
MKYSEAIGFLYESLPAYHRIGKAAYRDNLDNTLALDDYFGHPHFKYRTIHIAGTNGKGSVSHLIASVLMEAGYSTGLYTSPHLRDFRERILVNGEMISKKSVAGFVERHRKIIDELKPSFFEMTAAMAFHYFAVMKTDVAVIETGMGGRLDSTNIITPVLSVITNTGHDHMEFLGRTLPEIASEKAGIIKPGIPVVIGETQSETEGVFVARAAANNAEISFADKNFSCTPGPTPGYSENRKFIVKDLTEGRCYEGEIPLGGDYQKKNLQTLFQAMGMLRREFTISDQALLRGIARVVKNTRLLGRWQILSRDPLVICDTGHNPEGIKYVTDQLARTEAKVRHMVIGFVNDKDTDAVLPLFPRDAKYYFTRASIDRAMDEKVLMERAMEHGLKGSCWPTVAEALAAARENAAPSDLIFIGGSTFVVAEVI